MKSTLSIALFLIISSVSIQAANITANGKITDVIVYQDRAIVTRSATVQVPSGEQQVVFEGLPARLDENSVRAHGTGKNYKILGVEIRRDYQKVIENEESKKLRDQIKALQQKIQDAEDEQQDLTQKRDLLNRLSENIGSGSDKTPPSFTDVKNFADYYGAQITAITIRLRAIERSNVELEKQLQELNQQLATLTQPGSSDKRVVVVSINADSDTTVNLQVDYLVYNCNWQPQYDVHYRSGEKNINLTAYGIIRQNSGENWDGVKVTLSTARPQQGTSLPELSAWTVDVIDPHLLRRAAAPAPMAPPSQLYAADAKLKEEDRSNTTIVAGSVTEGDEDEPLSASQLLVGNVEVRGFTAVYKIAAPVTVPSDSQPHRCTISIQDLGADQSYVSTPKLNPGAFVKAKVKNANSAPLLPGQLNVFMENDFVGTSRLSLVGPEGVFDLFLGKDDSIKVQRKDKIRKDETSGLLTKTKSTKMGYSIELENMQNNPVTVTLKDQIPVSKNDKIKVSYKASVKPNEENKETGELTWQVNIPARNKVTVDVDFQIDYPTDMIIGGI